MSLAIGKHMGERASRRETVGFRRLVTAHMAWSPRRLSVDRQLCSRYTCVPLSTVATCGTPLRPIPANCRRFVAVARDGLRFCAFPPSVRERFAAGVLSSEWTEPGDVVLSETGERLSADVIDERFASYPISRRSTIVRATGVDPQWLAALFVSKTYGRYLKERQPVGSLKEAVFSSIIPACSHELQRICVNEIDSLWAASRKAMREAERLSEWIEATYWDCLKISRVGREEGIARTWLPAYASWSPRGLVSRLYVLKGERVPLDSLGQVRKGISPEYVEVTLRLPSFRKVERFRSVRGGRPANAAVEAAIPVPDRELQDRIVRRIRPLLDELKDLAARIVCRDDIRTSVISRMVFNEAD